MLNKDTELWLFVITRSRGPVYPVHRTFTKISQNIKKSLETPLLRPPPHTYPTHPRLEPVWMMSRRFPKLWEISWLPPHPELTHPRSLTSPHPNSLNPLTLTTHPHTPPKLELRLPTPTLTLVPPPLTPSPQIYTRWCKDDLTWSWRKTGWWTNILDMTVITTYMIGSKDVLIFVRNGPIPHWSLLVVENEWNKLKITRILQHMVLNVHRGIRLNLKFLTRKNHKNDNR